MLISSLLLLLLLLLLLCLPGGSSLHFSFLSLGIFFKLEEDLLVSFPIQNSAVPLISIKMISFYPIDSFPFGAIRHNLIVKHQ